MKNIESALDCNVLHFTVPCFRLWEAYLEEDAFSRTEYWAHGNLPMKTRRYLCVDYDNIFAHAGVFRSGMRDVLIEMGAIDMVFMSTPSSYIRSLGVEFADSDSELLYVLTMS